jgi:hypothetical protein
MFLAAKVTVENWKVNADKVTVRKLNAYCRQSYRKKIECLLRPKLQFESWIVIAAKITVRKLNVYCR